MSDGAHSSKSASDKNADQEVTLRRKMSELCVSRRKEARAQQFLKRRFMYLFEDMTPRQIVQGLNSADLNMKIASARAARRILSRAKEQNTNISEMVNAGVTAPLVKALDHFDCQDLQFEAAWAITNIASGTHEHSLAVIDAGAIPKLVCLLSAGGSLGDQSVWALGNIAGDGPESRDAVLAAGALPALLPLLVPGARPAPLRTATWTYTNLCCSEILPVRFELVAPGLPAMSELLAVNDKHVLVNVCWALLFLADGSNECIEAMQRTPLLLPRLVSLLEHRKVSVRIPALFVVESMLTGSEEQIERALDAGCLEPLCRLLQFDSPWVVKKVARAVSNLLAGTEARIQRAVDTGLLYPLVELLGANDAKCQSEAARAISNLYLFGTYEQLVRLTDTGFFKGFFAPSNSPGFRAVAMAVTKFGQVEILYLKLEDVGELDSIKRLQEQKNEQVL